MNLGTHTTHPHLGLQLSVLSDPRFHAAASRQPPPPILPMENSTWRGTANRPAASGSNLEHTVVLLVRQRTPQILVFLAHQG